jgi:ubiquinone/menaquinone biosynthesis C-methylase UbiE
MMAHSSQRRDDASRQVAGESTSVDEELQRRFFEDCATGYDDRFMRSRWPRNQQLKARVISESLVFPPDGGRIVEIGCGTGQIAAELLRENPGLQYVGLDLSSTMLDLARARLGSFPDRVDLRQVLGSLPLEPGSFDGAYGVDVLHHVDDPVRVLTELRACLEPGAPIVFLESNPRFPLTALIGLTQREERAIFKLTFANLRTWLSETRFGDASVEYGPLYTPPGPEWVIPFLDAVDRVAAHLPLVRSLAIFYVIRGRAPAVS